METSSSSSGANHASIQWLQSAPEHLTRHKRLVFVYGTLRRGGSNDINLRQPTPVYLGRASITGMLFDLGPYPGLALGASRDAVAVVGEVYAISPALEDNLDVLEGLLPEPSGEYAKRLVQTMDGVACIVYEINPLRVQACPAIQSGDWIAHHTQKTLA